MTMKIKAAGYESYEVYYAGQPCGQVRKTRRHGYTYWKIAGEKNTYRTREEAAQELYSRALSKPTNLTEVRI